MTDNDELTALKAENERLTKERDYSVKWANRSVDEIKVGIDELEVENERLRKALEWYANPEIYAPHPHGLAFDRRDLSSHAIEALKGSEA